MFHFENIYFDTSIKKTNRLAFFIVIYFEITLYIPHQGISFGCFIKKNHGKLQIKNKNVSLEFCFFISRHLIQISTGNFKSNEFEAEEKK